MEIGSLFSGVGGLELGLELSGLGKTIWQVEQNEFCKKVLAKHWPNVERFSNVKEVGAHNLAPVDVICGGFPCQDISSAGKGTGLSGSRSGLWFEFARIIEELRPTWVVIENVASGAKRWVDQVTAHLGQLGYETLPIPITAEALGAPHRRARIFLVAYSNSNTISQQQEPERPNKIFAKSISQKRIANVSSTWESQPGVCRAYDGIPNRLDRLRALGNAVVPQCAEVVGHIIRGLDGSF